jgi:hypothetical protein
VIKAEPFLTLSTGEMVWGWRDDAGPVRFSGFPPRSLIP